MTSKSDGACTALKDAGYISTHSCKVHEEGDSQMVTHHTHRCASLPANVPCVLCVHVVLHLLVIVALL